VNIELPDDNLEETFITKVTITNPKPDPVPVPSKYHCLFRGSPVVFYGRHLFRFPITHMGYKRLVSSLQSDFAGILKVDFGAAGFDFI